MSRRVLAPLIVLALATPSRALQQNPPPGPGIDHSPLKCLVENEHPHVRAALAAPTPVQKRRVYFKAHEYPDWYYIEMETAGSGLPNHLGILPKPLPGTSKVDYYLYALDAQLQAAQTPEYDPDVERTCRRDPGAWLPDQQALPRITIYATAQGQPPIPPGFAATGIVAFVSADGETLSDDDLAAAILLAPQGDPLPETAPETAALEAAPPVTEPPPVSAPVTEPAADASPRRRPVVTYLLIGGGALAVAAVAAGGSESSQPAAPTPLPSATPAPAPTPTPTPTPRCGYQARPATQTFSKAGGSGSCDISTAAECAWTAESSVNWIQVRGERSGRGSGRVRFDVAANNQGEQRRGFVRLRDREDVRCQIDQNAGGYTPPVAFVSSQLSVAGGVGRLLVDGAPSPLHAGRLQMRSAAGLARNRVEAELLSGRLQPGVWRFQIEGALRRESLRVERGRVVEQAGGTLVFHLRGQPGERVAFSFAID